jgi:8-oxo-dGTP pyrophosphatase MutT (NUDIX family)
MDCAIFVLWDAARRLALMEDRPDLKPGSDHYWVFPGGKVEDGERPADAMRREMAEEIGCLPGRWVWLPGEMRSRPIPGTRSFRAGHEGWRTHAFLVLEWAGLFLPERTLDHGAPLAWRDITDLAGPGDGFTCNAEIASAVLAELTAGTVQP